MSRLSEEKRKVVKPTGRKDGTYKVIQQVKPVTVFGRTIREPFKSTSLKRTIRKPK